MTQTNIQTKLKRHDRGERKNGTMIVHLLVVHAQPDQPPYTGFSDESG